MAKKITLEDTSVMMCSPDYRYRMIAEYWQVRIRKERLRDMLQKWEANQLDFEPKCPRALLKQQCELMGRYEGILRKRADLEHIDIQGMTDAWMNVQ